MWQKMLGMKERDATTFARFLVEEARIDGESSNMNGSKETEQ